MSGCRVASRDGRVIEEQEVEKAITMYYDMAGWDKEGVPTHAKLAELDLEWLEG